MKRTSTAISSLLPAVKLYQSSSDGQAVSALAVPALSGAAVARSSLLSKASVQVELTSMSSS